MCFCPSLCWDHSVSNNSCKFFACRNYIMSCCTSCGQRHLLYNVISQDTEKMYFSDFLWVWTRKIKWWQFVFYAMTRHGLCLCQQDDCKVQILSSSVWNDHIFERPGAAGTPWQYVWHSWSKRKHYTWKKPSLEWQRGKMQLYWLVEAESLVWIKVETCSIWSVLVRCAARTASVHVSGGMKDHCSKHLLICSESSL